MYISFIFLQTEWFKTTQNNYLSFHRSKVHAQQGLATSLLKVLQEQNLHVLHSFVEVLQVNLLPSSFRLSVESVPCSFRTEVAIFCWLVGEGFYTFRGCPSSSIFRVSSGRPSSSDTLNLLTSSSCFISPVVFHSISLISLLLLRAHVITLGPPG